MSQPVPDPAREALKRIDGVLAQTPLPGATRVQHLAIMQDVNLLHRALTELEQLRAEAAAAAAAGKPAPNA